MAYNIPRDDTTVVLVPGLIKTICEWLIQMGNPPRVATCVECAEDMADYLVKAGFPVSVAEVTALAQDLINRGQASASGATDYVAASQQMTRLGIPNTPYGANWFNAGHDWQGALRAAIGRGVPVLFGVYAAHVLYDDWTHTAQDGGVNGHAITIVGYDSTGCIVADPNTAQAQRGEFVHYGWANLASAFGGFPSMVIPEGHMALQISDVSSWFTAIDGQHWKCTKTGCIIGMGQLQNYQTMPALGTQNGLTALGLPITNEFWPMAGVGAQAYERGIVLYDPDRKFDNPPGASGPCYLGHLTDTRLNGVITQALQDALAKAQATAGDSSALSQQVAALQAKIVAAKSALG